MGEVEGEAAGMGELTSSNQPLSVRGDEGEPLGGLTAMSAWLTAHRRNG